MPCRPWEISRPQGLWGDYLEDPNNHDSFSSPIPGDYGTPSKWPKLMAYKWGYKLLELTGMISKYPVTPKLITFDLGSYLISDPIDTPCWQGVSYRIYDMFFSRLYTDP